MPVLTAIDTLAVQRYIFTSNRLKDVVTGSFLVKKATFDFISSAIDKLSLCNTEVILSRGGNAIVKFGNLIDAKKFASQYSRILYEQAPGLEVALVHEELNENFNSLDMLEALERVQVKLAIEKTSRIPAANLYGISVDQSCQETGLPANEVSEGVPLSNIIIKRREKINDANKKWQHFISDNSKFDFPMQLDSLGRSMGEESHIAVVHIDGNAVGKKIKHWFEKKKESLEESVDDLSISGLITEYRKWSMELEKLGRSVMESVVRKIENSIEGNKVKGFPENLEFELSSYNGKVLLPIRPIILGGDDMTFVCDARISFDLAITALNEFENGTIDIPELGNIKASAGIAVVGVRSPFSRAYDLSEKLCTSAKKKLVAPNGNLIDNSSIDWHIAYEKPIISIETMRKKEYTTKSTDDSEIKLTCRPYLLSNAPDSIDWEWFSNKLLNDSERGLRGKNWSKTRTKIKALREEIKRGPNSIRALFDRWHVIDRRLSLDDELTDGFISDRTPVLDAVEIMDIYLKLHN